MKIGINSIFLVVLLINNYNRDFYIFTFFKFPSSSYLKEKCAASHKLLFLL